MLQKTKTKMAKVPRHILDQTYPKSYEKRKASCYNNEIYYVQMKCIKMILLDEFPFTLTFNN